MHQRWMILLPMRRWILNAKPDRSRPMAWGHPYKDDDNKRKGNGKSLQGVINLQVFAVFQRFYIIYIAFQGNYISYKNW